MVRYELLSKRNGPLIWGLFFLLATETTLETRDETTDGDLHGTPSIPRCTHPLTLAGNAAKLIRKVEFAIETELVPTKITFILMPHGAPPERARW